MRGIVVRREIGMQHVDPRQARRVPVARPVAGIQSGQRAVLLSTTRCVDGQMVAPATPSVRPDADLHRPELAATSSRPIGRSGVDRGGRSGRANSGMRSRFRQAPGANPVVRLNSRRKKAGSSQPTRHPISSTGASVRSSRWASSMRRRWHQSMPSGRPEPGNEGLGTLRDAKQPRSAWHPKARSWRLLSSVPEARSRHS